MRGKAAHDGGCVCSERETKAILCLSQLSGLGSLALSNARDNEQPAR